MQFLVNYSDNPQNHSKNQSRKYFNNKTVILKILENLDFVCILSGAFLNDFWQSDNCSAHFLEFSFNSLAFQGGLYGNSPKTAGKFRKISF